MLDKSNDIKPVPVLTECAARSTPCRLHVLRSGFVSPARFHAVQQRQVLLRLDPDQKDDSLQSETLCCVGFHYQQFLCGFMVCVKQVRPVDGELEVQLEFPSELAAKNMRQSFRVPVVRDAGFELTMLLPDGTQLQGEAVNVSETGIEVNLPSDDNRLRVDQEVQFILRFRDDRLDLPAVVRRRDQARLGFQFVSGGEVASRGKLTALQRIVRSLEQLWLKSRLA